MHTTYLFHHIPKTAGTTVRKFLQSKMKDQSEFIHLTTKGDKIAKSLGLLPYKLRSLSERNKARVIFGHHVTVNTCQMVSNPVEHIVSFRSPKDWLISRYNQKMNRLFKNGSKTYSFEYWLTKMEAIHSQFDWLIIKFGNEIEVTDKISQLKKALDHFQYIYTTDKTGQLVFDLGKLLNIPYIKPLNRNVVGVDKINFFSPTLHEKNILNKIIEEDIEIYRNLILPLAKNKSIK